MGRRKRPKRYTSDAELRRCIARMLAAYGARVGQADVDEFRALLGLQEDLDLAIYTAVRGLRRTSWEWAEIADELGVTKQAAQQRFGPRSALARRAKSIERQKAREAEARRQREIRRRRAQRAASIARAEEQAREKARVRRDRARARGAAA